MTGPAKAGVAGAPPRRRRRRPGRLPRPPDLCPRGPAPVPRGAREGRPRAAPTPWASPAPPPPTRRSPGADRHEDAGGRAAFRVPPGGRAPRRPRPRGVASARTRRGGPGPRRAGRGPCRAPVACSGRSRERSPVSPGAPPGWCETGWPLGPYSAVGPANPSSVCVSRHSATVVCQIRYMFVLKHVTLIYLTLLARRRKEGLTDQTGGRVR